MTSGVFVGRRLAELAQLRSLATGEPYQTARTQIAAVGALLPAPVPDQQRWEARVLAALLPAFGSHRPADSGGPYGIARVTAHRDEVIVHVDRNQLPRWVAALVPVLRSDGTLTGVAGLRWSAASRAVVLHDADFTGRVILARTFPKEWQRAVRAAIADDDQLLVGTDRSLDQGTEEHTAARKDAAFLDPCADTLSAVLRRVTLLEELAKQPFHGGRVELRIEPDAGGAARLVDCSAGRSTLAAPWVTLHAPTCLWPACPTPAGQHPDAAAAVRSLLAELPAPEVDENPGRGVAAAGLCRIAGVRREPVALQAAAWALQVAGRQLVETANAYLWAEGGWVANRRRYAEDFIGQPGPLDPPGAGELLRDHDLDLAVLGRLAYLPIADFDGRDRDLAVELPGAGRQILLRLLDWALAAATRPGAPRYTWQQITPTDAYGLYPRLLPTSRWIAVHRLPGSPVPLQLRVDHGGPSKAYRYAIHPGPDGVPAWVHHANPALKFGNAPSLPAAMLMAEHAATEAAAGASVLRTAERRLLIEHPLSVDANPTVTELINAAAPREDVLDLYELFASLRSLAESELRHDDTDYVDPSAGHCGEEDESRVLNTVTAVIADDRVLPATRHGEPANTASADSSVYRRHLAAHRTALDPFATCYLAAADAVPGTALFSVRHAAGVAALQTADVQTLQHLDPRPSVDDMKQIIASLPADIRQIEPFFDAWYTRREALPCTEQ